MSNFRKSLTTRKQQDQLKLTKFCNPRLYSHDAGTFKKRWKMWRIDPSSCENGTFLAGRPRMRQIFWKQNSNRHSLKTASSDRSKMVTTEAQCRFQSEIEQFLECWVHFFCIKFLGTLQRFFSSKLLSHLSYASIVWTLARTLVP